MAERSLENSLPAGIGRITESILEEARQTAEEMERKAREEAAGRWNSGRRRRSAPWSWNWRN